MASNPYLIAGTDCLKNKLGFTDRELLAKAEQEITSARLLALEANPLPGNLDYQYLKAIHFNLFRDLYDWAGKERTVQTVKGVSRFEWPERIGPQATLLFDELGKENNLQGMERESFIERAAHYFSELNVIHPFPEGNGRAQRVLFDQIARRAGYQFHWDRTTRDQVIESVIHAYAVDTSKLEEMFEQTLSSPERQIARRHNPSPALEEQGRSDAIEPMAPEKAEETLTSQAQLNLAVQQRILRAELARLEATRDTAKQALHEHRGTLEKNEDNPIEVAEHKRLNKAFALANREVRRVEAEFHARAEYREYEALKIARQQHPEAARVVSDLKARRQAAELSARWKGLEQKIQSLGDRGEHEAVIGCRRELSNLLSGIDRNEPVKAALPQILRDRVSPARQENERAIGQSLERGRERER